MISVDSGRCLATKLCGRAYINSRTQQTFKLDFQSREIDYRQGPLLIDKNVEIAPLGVISSRNRPENAWVIDGGTCR